MDHFRLYMEELKIFSVWIFYSLVDGVFLAIWGFVQVLIDQTLSNLQLPWVDSRVLVAIQLLFAITTLVPILIHICVNVSHSFAQGYISIRKELDELRATFSKDMQENIELGPLPNTRE